MGMPPDLDPELSVKVKGKELVVTLPGTDYAVTYFKRSGAFGLLAKDIANKDDPAPNDVGSISLQGVEASQREGERSRLDCIT
jgi:hypothetical protein